jgi:hypothetical protein
MQTLYKQQETSITHDTRHELYRVLPAGILRVLVGCEESQEVCKAFRTLGHIAFSNDIEDCSGGHPEWHLKMDVFEAAKLAKWDIAIFFPPCTYLTCTANRSFINNPERWEKRLEAVKFVHKLMNLDIERIAIENPKGVISTHIRKPDQYIQPYEFGHTDSKMTGLWLKNLPPLKPTEIVTPEWIISPSGKRHSKTHWQNPSTNNPDNAKKRSKTYSGIAKAMSEQWSSYACW